jgi:hypothetical protein
MWILRTIVYCYDACNSTDILCCILWVSPHPLDAPIDRYMDINKWIWICVKDNIYFNVSFNILLEQFNCAFSWINKELDDNIYSLNLLFCGEI